MDLDDSLEYWPRTRFTPLPLRSLFYYVLYGDLEEVMPEVPVEQYRSLGIPEGVKLNYYKRETNPEMWEQFQVGQAWDDLLQSNPSLVQKISQSPTCVILQGEMADSDSLDAMRDVIGLITYLFDCGAAANFDVLTQSWFDMMQWRTSVFDRGMEAVASMVVIESEFIDTSKSDAVTSIARIDSNNRWIYTHGMRKFARPDLSVRNVPPEKTAAVYQLIDFLVSTMIDGIAIPPHQQLQFPELQLTVATKLIGDLHEPHFHNFVLELEIVEN